MKIIELVAVVVAVMAPTLVFIREFQQRGRKK